MYPGYEQKTDDLVIPQFLSELAPITLNQFISKKRPNWGPCTRSDFLILFIIGKIASSKCQQL